MLLCHEYPFDIEVIDPKLPLNAVGDAGATVDRVADWLLAGV